MIRRLIKIILLGALSIALIGVGGYTIYSFKDQVILKDPVETLKPIAENIPNIPYTNPLSKFKADSDSEENHIILFEKNYRDFKKKDLTNRLVIIVDDQEFEVTENTIMSVLSSVNEIYHEGSTISYRTDDLSNEKISYTKTPTDLYKLVNTLNIVNTIEQEDGFDSNEFTQPEKMYKLDKNEVNTFDYSLYTSANLISADPLKYKCPLSNAIITDKNNIKYNYIIPLESVYLRGGKDWNINEKNEYGTSLLTGVCTSTGVNPENKSILEYLPDTNKGDYCYTWLVLCSYYELDITSEELNQCLENITSESHFLGGIEK